MEFSQLLDLILHIDKSLGSMLVSYGPLVYAILFAIVFAETGLVVFPFLPGDTLLFMGGAFCASGSMNAPLLNSKATARCWRTVARLGKKPIPIITDGWIEVRSKKPIRFLKCMVAKR